MTTTIDPGTGERGDGESAIDAAAAEARRREVCAALLRSLESVTVARPTAMEVLTVVDNPHASARRVAAAIELDPTFAAQILRLANSAYYGMSGRVGNTGFAVTVVGFAAVRSMAAMRASGLSSGRGMPDRFWTHAAAAGVAASLVAPRYGVAPADGLAAGLLHDLGAVFLRSFDRDGYQALVSEHGSDGEALAAAERDTFGLSHDEAAAHVLEAWRFPAPFIEAVAWHHRATTGQPTAVAVRVGDLIAHVADRTAGPGVVEELIMAGVSEVELEVIVDETRRRSDDILATLPAAG